MVKYNNTYYKTWDELDKREKDNVLFWWLTEYTPTTPTLSELKKTGAFRNVGTTSCGWVVTSEHKEVENG